ncbi:MULTISPECIES: hypothetical protein [unclassified Streptomyces]|nr:hypothetical protein [Streptomyces sp. NBC_00183]MCX5288619.1 hypothetical protein [Streptomyces sp. NBC_00183]
MTSLKPLKSPRFLKSPKSPRFLKFLKSPSALLADGDFSYRHP